MSFEVGDPITYATIPSSDLDYYPVEEINILLAFFHMSSVVRYDPIFVDRLLNSEAMPLLLTLRRHALYKFLVAFYSYVMQERVIITHI